MTDFSSFSEEMPSSPILWQRDTTLSPYPAALQTMRDRVQAIREGRAEEAVWLTEHAPLFTAGTSARAEDLFNPHNYPIYEAGRGGQWTYHGPGQRLAYVILDLTRPHGIVPPRDVRAFVQGLECWLTASLARLGIRAFTRRERIGLWCLDPYTAKEAKIAAIGVRISRWVSWHGISLNVCPDLDDFDGIVPCGIRDYGVTSLARFDASLTMNDADQALKESWTEIFGNRPEETTCVYTPFGKANASFSGTGPPSCTS